MNILLRYLYSKMGFLRFMSGIYIEGGSFVCGMEDVFGLSNVAIQS